MKIEKAFSLLIIVVVNIVLLPGCSTNISPTPTETTPAPTSIWFGLLERTPLPHTTALPEAEWTPIDGTYAKLDPSEPQWWSCRRCADYRPAGGIWKLQFSQGVMRIYYDVTGWASLASYSVEEDRLFIYNDPYCPEEVGEYQWELEDRWGLADRFLRLSLIDDPCSIRLRGENLSAQEWGSCMPPNEMTGASDHWHKPIGCEPSFTSEEGPAPPENLTITVQPGDARHFDISPELYAHANNDAVPPPDGIKLSSHADSIPYGLSRVLWGKEVWVEATTSQPFSAIGVQFLGDQTIGWARVLFDGAEVWRGNTSTIWSQDRSFGGYIEISNFSPGEHTIRAESLGFDYHPVTVAFFGFNLSGKTEVAFP